MTGSLWKVATRLDCTFKTKEGRFNYRVGGIILNEGKMLVVTNPKEDYYYSVGGRVQMNETMDQAVEREIFEETGCHVLNKRLGIVHEKFFTSSVTNEKYHKISMYYYVEWIKRESSWVFVNQRIWIIRIISMVTIEGIREVWFKTRFFEKYFIIWENKNPSFSHRMIIKKERKIP